VNMEPVSHQVVWAILSMRAHNSASNSSMDSLYCFIGVKECSVLISNGLTFNNIFKQRPVNNESVRNHLGICL